MLSFFLFANRLFLCFCWCHMYSICLATCKNRIAYVIGFSFRFFLLLFGVSHWIDIIQPFSIQMMRISLHINTSRSENVLHHRNISCVFSMFKVKVEIRWKYDVWKHFSIGFTLCLMIWQREKSRKYAPIRTAGFGIYTAEEVETRTSNKPYNSKWNYLWGSFYS